MNELLQTILEGALGGLTFGIYHAYTTAREMKRLNGKMENRYNAEIRRLKSIPK